MSPVLPESKIDGRRSVGFEGVAVFGQTRLGGGVKERRAHKRLVRLSALLGVVALKRLVRLAPLVDDVVDGASVGAANLLKIGGSAKLILGFGAPKNTLPAAA